MTKLLNILERFRTFQSFSTTFRTFQSCSAKVYAPKCGNYRRDQCVQNFLIHHRAFEKSTISLPRRRAPNTIKTVNLINLCLISSDWLRLICTVDFRLPLSRFSLDSLSIATLNVLHSEWRTILISKTLCKQQSAIMNHVTIQLIDY